MEQLEKNIKEIILEGLDAVSDIDYENYEEFHIEEMVKDIMNLIKEKGKSK